MASKWGIFATMPRNAGVSGRTTTRFMVFSPSDRTMALCFSGQQMVLPTSLILIQFALSLVILHYLLQTQSSHFGYLGLVAQLLQRIDGRLPNVGGVVRANRFGQHVRYSDRLNHGSNRAARDHAGAFRSGLEQHQAAAETSQYSVQNSGLENVDLAQILFRRLDALLDRGGNFLGLTRAEAYDLVARGAVDHERGKAQIFAALHHFGDAVDRNHLLFQVQRTGVDSFCRGCCSHSLELQSCLSSGISQSLYSAMVQIAAAIEYNFLDALCLGTLSDQFADLFCSRQVSTVPPTRLLSAGRGRGHGMALTVVDHLRVNMLQTAEHSQAG